MSHRGGRPVERSENPALAQRRLRDLILANATIVERLDLEIVLRRIVEAAMALVDASYGALGVLATHGGLERFIHVGIDPVDAERIGHPPTGKGLLGAVITDRTSIRLPHLAEDPRSVGFPEHHPMMDAFLGVPVRVGDDVYGNLYLTRGSGGPFTADDEELIVALAGTAGIAIEHARLYNSAKTLEVWSTTAAEVMVAMLEVSDESVLEVIAEHVGALIEADLVLIAVPHDDHGLRVTAARGSGGASFRGRVLPASRQLISRARAGGRTTGGAGAADQSPVDWQPGSGPTLVLPLANGEEPLGILAISRQAGASRFTDADLDMAFAFAAQASVSIEIVRAREDRHRLDTYRDHARIARELHDQVIQRLFGAGLSLQAVSSTVDAEASAEIEREIDVIDAAIKEIRTVVFTLGAGEPGRMKRTRERLLDAVAELSSGLSSTPRIAFTGPLDSLVSEALTEDLVAVLRDCLADPEGETRARAVDIAIGIADGLVTVVIEDTIDTMSQGGARSGAAGPKQRAHARGGAFTLTSRSGGGSHAEWSARADSIVRRVS